MLCFFLEIQRLHDETDDADVDRQLVEDVAELEHQHSKPSQNLIYTIPYLK